MADINKTVEIIFGAVDNTGSGLKSIGSSIDSATQQIGNITGPLADVTESILKTETAIVALAAAYGGFAVNEAIKFQNAQIDLEKVLSDTDPSVETFTQTVTDLSEKYGVAADNILQGIAVFKQAGFTAEESAQLQKNALDLVIAGDVEAAQATEILIAQLKGFGAQASESSRFIEAMNNVSNQFATDLGELAKGMAGISPIAKTMGFSFEETAGLITPVIEVFRSGDEAANALKTGLLRLVDDAKPVREALAAIGVSQTDLNGNMRSGKDIFNDVAKAFQNIDQNQKLLITSQLVGIDQAARMVTVFDNLAKVQDVTAVAMEKTGSALKEVELRLGSAGKQVDIAFESFKNLARSVGTELLPSFGDVAAGANTLIQAFRDIVEAGGLAPLFDALDRQGGDIRQFFEDVAKALPEAFEGLDFSGLLKSFDSLKNSIAGLFGDLDLTKPDELRVVLQNLVDFISLLTNASAGAVQGIEPLIDGIVKFLQTIADSGAETQTFIGNIGGLAISIDKVLPLLNFMADGLELVGKAIIILAGAQTLSAIKNLSVLNTTIGTAGLVSSGTTAGNVLSKLIPILGSAGIAGAGLTAAGAIGYTSGKGLAFAIDTLISKATGSKTSLGSFIFDLTHSGESAETASTSISQLANDASNLSDATEASAKGIRDYDAEVQAAADKGFDFAAAVNDVAESLGLVGDSADDVVGSFRTLEEAEAAAIAEIDKGKQTAITFADGMFELHASNKAVSESSQDVAEAVEDTSKALVRGSAEWKRVQDVMLETTKQANDFQIQLAELANKRYEIDVRAAVDLQTAQIQADTQRIQSAMEAVASSIESLTEASTDLWGLWSGASAFDKSDLRDAALRMEKRLDDELELKKQLTDAIVAQSIATTQRLLSGEPIIQIDGGQLSPELEMIFDKILEYTQIRASNEGLNLLLGVGV